MEQKFKKIIEENPMALASTNSDGTPNVIAVAYVKVVSDNILVITDNYMKTTANNIKNNSDVCLACWDKNWNGVKVVGQAEYYSQGKWKKFVEDMPENKGEPAKGAILINIKEIKKLS